MQEFFTQIPGTGCPDSRYCIRRDPEMFCGSGTGEVTVSESGLELDDFNSADFLKKGVIVL